MDHLQHKNLDIFFIFISFFSKKRNRWPIKRNKNIKSGNNWLSSYFHHFFFKFFFICSSAQGKKLVRVPEPCVRHFRVPVSKFTFFIPSLSSPLFFLYFHVCVFHFLFVPNSLLVFLYFRPGRRRSHLAAVAVTAVGSDSTVLLCSFIFRVVLCEAISRRSPIRHFGHFERNALIFFVNFEFCRAEPSSGGEWNFSLGSVKREKRRKIGLASDCTWLCVFHLVFPFFSRCLQPLISPFAFVLDPDRLDALRLARARHLAANAAIAGVRFPRTSWISVDERKRKSLQ